MRAYYCGNAGVDVELNISEDVDFNLAHVKVSDFISSTSRELVKLPNIAGTWQSIFELSYLARK